MTLASPWPYVAGALAFLTVVAFALLWLRDWRIDHALDGLDLTPDDAPRDDNDWPPEPRTAPRRLNGDT